MPTHEIIYRHGEVTRVILLSDLPAAARLPAEFSEVDHDALARAAVAAGRMYASNLDRVPRK